MLDALAISLAITAQAQPAAAPAAEPAKMTFCGRMAGPYRMRPHVYGKGTVFVTQLKGQRGRMGYSGQYDPAKVKPELLEEYRNPCAKSAFRIRCVMRGPGELTVQAGGHESVWPIHEGENAIVDYDGDRIACLDFRSE